MPSSPEVHCLPISVRKDKRTYTFPGNNGLGLESCLKLARANAHVYLTARNQSKAETAISSIKERVPNAQISYLELDLTSFASVKKAAETFNESCTRLDILINNAGVMALPEGLTAEGYEIQFGTNHIGHALLTKLLMPTLLKTASAGADVRIINLSSSGHQLAPYGGLVLEKVRSDMKNYSTWTRYGQSKLANILFTKSLHRRYPTIKSIAVHPGAVDTGLSIPSQDMHPWLTFWVKPLVWWLLKTPEVGALTQLFASVSKEAKGGCYYVPVAKEVAPSSYARDERLAEVLWDWTEEQFNEKGY